MPVAAASPTMNGISDSTAGHHIFVITLPGVAGDPVAIPVEGSLAGTTLQDLLKDWATRCSPSPPQTSLAVCASFLLLRSPSFWWTLMHNVRDHKSCNTQWKENPPDCLP